MTKKRASETLHLRWEPRTQDRHRAEAPGRLGDGPKVYKVPRYVQFLPELPSNVMLKVEKVASRQQAPSAVDAVTR